MFQPFIAHTESRRNNLDCLRFLLACVVIHTHSYRMTGQENVGMMARLKHLEFGGAWLAVDGFFIISGFLITQSFMRSKSPLDYGKRRALRIYPGFIASILLCIFIVGPLGGAAAAENGSLYAYFTNPQTYAFFRPLAFGPNGTLPGVFAHQSWTLAVNDSLWTIRYELFCYILLAALGLARLLTRPWVVLALFVLAVASQCAQESQWPGRWVMVAPYFGDLWEIIRFIVFFLAGAAFFLFRHRIPFSTLLALAAAGLLAAGFLLHATTALLPLCGTYLLLFIAFHPRIPLQNFSKYGDFSYGMYLYAFPIQQLLVMYVPAARSNPIILSTLAFFLTLAAAIISWHFLEKRFLKFKRATATVPIPPAPAHSVAEGALR